MNAISLRAQARFPFAVRVLGIAGFVLFAASGRWLSAQEYGNNSNGESVETLQRRLGEAEQRIQELQFQFDESRWSEATGTPATSASTSNEAMVVSARLAKLEKAMESMGANLADDKWAPLEKPTVKVFGRLQMDYWGFPSTTEGIDWFENPTTGDDPQDRFLFRRARIGVGGDLADTMEYKLEMDFAHPNNPAFKDAYFGFKELPNNQRFLIGNQKRPYGLDSLNSSRYIIFMERPLVDAAFNDGERRLGMCMYGYTDDEVYNWRYGMFLLADVAETGQYIGDQLQLSGNGRLAASPWYDEVSGGRGYLHLAISGMVANPAGNAPAGGPYNNEARFRTRPEARSTNRWIDTNPIVGADWFEILGAETIINVGAFQVGGEYMANWVQRDATTPGTGPDAEFNGGYVYISYFLTGEHIPLERTEGVIGRVKPFENFYVVDRCCGGHATGWGAWQVAARWSYLDLTDDAIRGGVENNTTLAVNWYWTPYAKMMFNVIYGNIEDHRAVNGFTGGDFLIIGTRFACDW